jgi:hypothetical protein
MKHNISIVFKDNLTHNFIEHEDFNDNYELVLNSLDDEGTIDILLKVNEIILDDEVFKILSRRFSVIKRKLYITVEKIN